MSGPYAEPSPYAQPPPGAPVPPPAPATKGGAYSGVYPPGPAMDSSPKEGTGKFSSGICSWCENWEVCCYTFCCTGCQTARNRAAVEGKNVGFGEYCLGCVFCTLSLMMCPSCQMWYEWNTRDQMIKGYSFKPGTSDDFWRVLCCLCCVTCQHRREVLERGAATAVDKM
eukprot:TRINITY_DN81154_c0_g1_i1.p1 TRINITY_DN81154_c0_g1~~TRINITY_DN81154_c0_g1_i1.p1  ORF type:complete len:169 (-),score=29.26 TRINITY_DN81154_c0_g1_i1:267-773(-)